MYIFKLIELSNMDNSCLMTGLKDGFDIIHIHCIFLFFYGAILITSYLFI